MGILSMFILLVLTELSNMLAQPKGFTDDPYVDDEKFIEKGNIFCLLFKKVQNKLFQSQFDQKLKVSKDVKILAKSYYFF